MFSFRNCYLPPELSAALLQADDEITALEEAAFRHASACLRAEKAALRLIARAEQCTNGLRRKLEKRSHAPACINAVIERLCTLHLIDDRRFAQLWLQSRLRLSRSPYRLLIALCSRGIDREDSQSALKNALDDETEYALLVRFAKKHERKAARKNKGEDTSRSLKYLLKTEGFSNKAIERYLDN